MKIAVELPDDLLQQAEATNARHGIGLGDLVAQGLRLALEAPPAPPAGQRAPFPLIRSSGIAPPLTDGQVAAALADDVDGWRHAGSVP